MANTKTILLVEDRANDRELYKAWLQNSDHDYTVIGTDNLVSGTALYSAHKPDCVVLDFILPDGDGLEFIMNLSRNGAHKVPVVFITGYGSAELMEDTREMGAFKTIGKDQLNAQTLCESVDSTINHFSTT